MDKTETPPQMYTGRHLIVHLCHFLDFVLSGENGKFTSEEDAWVAYKKTEQHERAQKRWRKLERGYSGIQ